jgi:hypothetical protein
MSESDIEAGARWGREIESNLQETKFGIICLTKDNQFAPWLLFEAGALAKAVANTFVCPYLIGLDAIDISQGPLTLNFRQNVQVRSKLGSSFVR